MTSTSATDLFVSVAYVLYGVVVVVAAVFRHDWEAAK